MWLFRFLGLLGLPVLTGLAFFLSSAPGQQPGQPAPAAPTPPPAPKADAKAAQALQNAIDRLDAKKVAWLEATLWQHLASQGLAFDAQGDYLSGPDHRLRLNLKVRAGGTTGEMNVVCDGTYLWTAMSGTGQPRTVTKWNLKEVQQSLDHPNMVPQLRDAFYQSQCFQGIVPVLDNLRQQMVMTRQENIQWQGHDVLQLTAAWNAEITKELLPASGVWQVLVPRECRLLLDAKTYWPYRLEWWGPIMPRGPDVLIMETEYRNPHITNAGDKPPEAYAKAFVFDPGKDKVTDETQRLVDTFLPFTAKRPDSSKTAPPKK
jgi:hypothetical protein